MINPASDGTSSSTRGSQPLARSDHDQDDGADADGISSANGDIGGRVGGDKNRSADTVALMSKLKTQKTILVVAAAFSLLLIILVVVFAAKATAATPGPPRYDPVQDWATQIPAGNSSTTNIFSHPSPSSASPTSKPSETTPIPITATATPAPAASLAAATISPTISAIRGNSLPPIAGESPSTLAPATEAPITQLPTTNVPITLSPTSAVPITVAPTTATPTTSLPLTAAPTTGMPNTARPITGPPTTVMPTSGSPITATPTTVPPTSANPTTSRPATATPTTAPPNTVPPTSRQPTTSLPTTANPTSARPATATPTSAKPSTAAPTTARPTSAKPSTAAPTTAKPTTAPPTTQTPTTQTPTTRPPTPLPTPNPTPGFQERHSTNEEFLDLLDWEQDSLERLLTFDDTLPRTRNTRSVDGCFPPNGVSTSCCIGAFSSGSEMTNYREHFCARSMKGGQAIDSLKNDAQAFLKQNPLPNNNEDDLACDVCQIVELIRRTGLRLAMIGDSTQNQVSGGFECELERRNYQVERSVREFDAPHVDWAYREHQYTRTIKIRSPLWEDSNEVVTIHYHQMYLLPLVDPRQMLDITENVDVLVLGFGLHWRYSNDTPQEWRRADKYQDAMMDLFRKLKLQGTVKLLVHREATSEHYDGPGGDWYQWYWNHRDETKDEYCQPIRPNDPVAGWRERSVTQAAQETGYDLVMARHDMPAFPSGTGRPELVVLPYFNFTRHQYSMHPFQAYSPVAQDCTHWCSAPFLYVPLWRSLRLAIARQFGEGV